MKERILIFLAAISIANFASAETQAWRELAVKAVQPGAVVARRGLDSDRITQAVLWGQGGGKWSHVGIAIQLIPNGQIYIESAMPGAGTRLDTPKAFFSEEQASAGEVFPVPIGKADAIQNAAKSLLGRPFDNALDLGDNGEKLYCSELVAIALREAGVIDALPTRSVTFLQKKVVAPDDVAASVGRLAKF